MKKIFLLASLLLITLPSFAKVGDSAMALKGRLNTRSGACLIYNTIDMQYREISELPYKNLVLLMPKDTTHTFFFKGVNGKAATSVDVTDQFDLDGWEVHTIVYKNISVMESYRRYPFINLEELARLMQALLKDKKDVTWIASSSFVQGATSEDDEDSIYDDSEQIMKHIASILPKIKSKRIEIEIPKEFVTGNSFNETLARKIYNEAKAGAYDRRKAEVESDRERVAQATARKTTKQRSDAKDAAYKKISTMGISSASSLESVNIKTERDAEGTEVKLYTNIPSQADTAFGFNYISTDGTLRAKMILGQGNVPIGLLVVDSRFDKLIRSTMDEQYKRQAKARDDLAKQAVSSF